MFLRRADPFAKKDWYDVKAPSTFSTRQVGKTLVTRTQGTKVGLFSISLFQQASLSVPATQLSACQAGHLSLCWLPSADCL